jgi:hypothetical protein
VTVFGKSAHETLPALLDVSGPERYLINCLEKVRLLLRPQCGLGYC